MALEIDWSTIECVLLDMDGTLIDLHFDNTLWNSHLPEVYAQANALSIEHSREFLFEHMRTNARTIEFYCLDYWAKFTDLNILELHADMAALLQYRPGTRKFLDWLQDHPARSLLATNAHRDSVDFKESHLRLLDYFDTVVSSHDYQQVKESPGFWQRLTEEQNIDPKRTLFVDDNEHVLDAAAQFGIREVLCIASPDSQREPRTSSAHRMIHHLDELISSESQQSSAAPLNNRRHP